MIIDVHSDEFADIVMAYLLDMCRDDERLPDNPRFKHFIDSMSGRGMKQETYKAFLEMGVETRIKYRRLKKTVKGDGVGSARIEITAGKTGGLSEEFDRELCKQVFRKIKDVRWKHPSKILTEERIDKIIDFCIKQKEKNNG